MKETEGAGWHMCCIQIDVHALLENILGSPRIHHIIGGKISIYNIRDCGIYLENNLPGYVNCVTDCQILDKTVRSYGYTVNENKQIDPDEVAVTRDNCNSIYPQELAQEIEEIVDAFFERNLYAADVKIVRIKRVYAD